MTRKQELEMYLAVCECRSRIARGLHPDEAAARSVHGREVLAEEVKRYAMIATLECAGTRQAMLEAGRQRLHSASQ